MGVALETVFDPAVYPHAAVPCNLCGSTDVLPMARFDRYDLPTSIVRCRHCGLEFISPRMSAEGYAAFYRDGYRPLVNTWLKNLNRVPEPGADEGYPEMLVHLTRRWMPSTGHLLDVGGSTGRISRAFANAYGYETLVVDPSAEELAQATGATLCLSAEAMQFSAASFDVILCCRTFDHLLDPKSVMTRMADWIRPGGVLICDIMDTSQWPLHSRYKLDHPYAFTGRTLRKLLNAAGWGVRMKWTFRQRRYVGFVCERIA